MFLRILDKISEISADIVGLDEDCLVDESQTCSECGKTFNVNLDEYYLHCCSKRCWERINAATMDGYDVDDPDNPMYSNRSYASKIVRPKISTRPYNYNGLVAFILLITFLNGLVSFLQTQSESYSITMTLIRYLFLWLILYGWYFSVIKFVKWKFPEKEASVRETLKYLLYLFAVIYVILLF